jgi:hypothetical protein
MYKSILAALCVSAIGFSAQAASLSGVFNVDIRHLDPADDIASQATRANFNALTSLDTILYTGNIDFETKVGSGTTIGSWLNSGVTRTGPGASVTGLDPATANTQQSKGNVFANPGNGKSTFYLFSSTFANAFDLTFKHDDGIAVFDDGVLLGDRVGPTALKTTQINGFDGGLLEILYVASNSDPSILHATASTTPVPAPVPLPAAAWLLLSGIGGLAAMARRRA